MLLLAEGLAQRGHECTIITFRAEPGDPNPAGVRIIDLGRSRSWDFAGFVRRLGAAVRVSGTEVIYSFLPVANVLALLLRGWRPSLRVVLGLRASDMDLRRYDQGLRLAHRAEALLARRADAIIVNSDAGYRHALARGIPSAKMTVIRNGIDLDRFRRQPDDLRAELGIAANALVVGAVGRADPMKDLDSAARALALLGRLRSSVAGLVAGIIPDDEKTRLEHLAEGVPIRWCGWRTDMARFYSSLDVFCLSSIWGEGTSNAIAEAMACGVPCVATEIGDNALLIGDTGRMVPPGDPKRMAEAIAELAASRGEGRLAASDAARARIAVLCGRETMIDRTIDVLQTVCTDLPVS